MATIDTGSLYEDCVQNVVELLANNKGNLNLREVHDTELAYVTQFPCMTVEFDSATEGIEEMGVTSGGTYKARADVILAITYFHEEWTERTRRIDIRKQLDKIVDLLRENWDVNDFCQRWGSSVDSVTSTDLLSPRGDIISGGRIMFTMSKELLVTLR